MVENGVGDWDLGIGGRLKISNKNGHCYLR